MGQLLDKHSTVSTTNTHTFPLRDILVQLMATYDAISNKNETTNINDDTLRMNSASSWLSYDVHENVTTKFPLNLHNCATTTMYKFPLLTSFKSIEIYAENETFDNLLNDLRVKHYQMHKFMLECNTKSCMEFIVHKPQKFPYLYKSNARQQQLQFPYEGMYTCDYFCTFEHPRNMYSVEKKKTDSMHSKQGQEQAIQQTHISEGDEKKFPTLQEFTTDCCMENKHKQFPLRNAKNTHYQMELTKCAQIRGKENYLNTSKIPKYINKSTIWRRNHIEQFPVTRHYNQRKRQHFHFPVQKIAEINKLKSNISHTTTNNNNMVKNTLNTYEISNNRCKLNTIHQQQEDINTAYNNNANANGNGKMMFTNQKCYEKIVIDQYMMTPFNLNESNLHIQSEVEGNFVINSIQQRNQVHMPTFNNNNDELVECNEHIKIPKPQQQQQQRQHIEHIIHTEDDGVEEAGGAQRVDNLLKTYEKTSKNTVIKEKSQPKNAINKNIILQQQRQHEHKHVEEETTMMLEAFVKIEQNLSTNIQTDFLNVDNQPRQILTQKTTTATCSNDIENCAHFQTIQKCEENESTASNIKINNNNTNIEILVSQQNEQLYNGRQKNVFANFEFENEKEISDVCDQSSQEVLDHLIKIDEQFTNLDNNQQEKEQAQHVTAIGNEEKYVDNLHYINDNEQIKHNSDTNIEIHPLQHQRQQLAANKENQGNVTSEIIEIAVEIKELTGETSAAEIWNPELLIDITTSKECDRNEMVLTRKNLKLDSFLPANEHIQIEEGVVRVKVAARDKMKYDMRTDFNSKHTSGGRGSSKNVQPQPPNYRLTAIPILTTHQRPTHAPLSKTTTPQLTTSMSFASPAQVHARNYAPIVNNKLTETTVPTAVKTQIPLPTLTTGAVAAASTTTPKRFVSLDVESVLPERTRLRRQRRMLSQNSTAEQPEDALERLNRLRARISGALSEVKGVLKQYSVDANGETLQEVGAPNTSSIALQSACQSPPLQELNTASSEQQSLPIAEDSSDNKRVDVEKQGEDGPINCRFVRKVRRKSIFDEQYKGDVRLAEETQVKSANDCEESKVPAEQEIILKTKTELDKILVKTVVEQIERRDAVESAELKAIERIVEHAEEQNTTIEMKHSLIGKKHANYADVSGRRASIAAVERSKIEPTVNSTLSIKKSIKEQRRPSDSEAIIKKKLQKHDLHKTHKLLEEIGNETSGNETQQMHDDEHKKLNKKTNLVHNKVNQRANTTPSVKINENVANDIDIINSSSSNNHDNVVLKVQNALEQHNNKNESNNNCIDMVNECKNNNKDAIASTTTANTTTSHLIETINTSTNRCNNAAKKFDTNLTNVDGLSQSNEQLKKTNEFNANEMLAILTSSFEVDVKNTKHHAAVVRVSNETNQEFELGKSKQEVIELITQANNVENLKIITHSQQNLAQTAGHDGKEGGGATDETSSLLSSPSEQCTKISSGSFACNSIATSTDSLTTAKKSVGGASVMPELQAVPGPVLVATTAQDVAEVDEPPFNLRENDCAKKKMIVKKMVRKNCLKVLNAEAQTNIVVLPESQSPVPEELIECESLAIKPRKVKKKVIIKRQQRRLSVSDTGFFREPATTDDTDSNGANDVETLEKPISYVTDDEEDTISANQADEEGEDGEKELVTAVPLKSCLKSRELEVGDWVMYAERYKKTMVRWKKGRVIERITSISYKLEIDGKEVPAHISYIKKYTDRKVNFGGKEYLEINYEQIEEEEKARSYSIWNLV